jgi:hypothetical protein
VFFELEGGNEWERNTGQIKNSKRSGSGGDEPNLKLTLEELTGYVRRREHGGAGKIFVRRWQSYE